MHNIEQFYSGVTPEGKLILAPAFAKSMQRCYQQNANSRAMDAAPGGILHCACNNSEATDAESNGRPAYYDELEKLYASCRGVMPPSPPQEIEAPKLGDMANAAQATRQRGERDLAEFRRNRARDFLPDEP